MTGGGDITSAFGAGGGLSVFGLYAHLINSRVYDNTVTALKVAQAYGAGVYWSDIYGQPLQSLMQNVTIARNHIRVNASGNALGQGAGVYIYGSVSLRDSTIEENSASLGDAQASFPLTFQGGGLYVTQNLTMVSCNVTANRLIAAPSWAIIGKAEVQYLTVSYYIYIHKAHTHAHMHTHTKHPNYAHIHTFALMTRPF